MRRIAFAPLVAFGVLVSALCAQCGRPDCAQDLEHWIEESPNVLAELDSVRQGLVGDSTIVSEFGDQGFLFIHPRDTASSSVQQNAPLMQWFRSGKQWIAIDRDHIQACFRECGSGRYAAHGYLIQWRMPHGYSSAVEIVDTRYLGEGWYAQVTTCTGCGD